MSIVEKEIPSGQEIKTYDELVVGLPKDNLTILDLARKMAGAIRRSPIPSGSTVKSAWTNSERQKLNSIVRYKPERLARIWTLANTKNKGLETLSYLFEMDNGLAASGLWVKGIDARANAPATLVLHDQGRKAAAADVSSRVNRDEQVLALDLTFFGDAWKDLEPFSYAQILDAEGERAVGIQAAQLIAIAEWLRKRTGAQKVRLESRGIRTEAIALVATALQPDVFSNVVVHEGIASLDYVLQVPVTFQNAPELFCLDLYKEFDIDHLAAMAAPAEVRFDNTLKMPQR